MASIRKRGDKWHVQVRRKHYPTQTRTFSRKGDAMAWATETERQVERRGLPTDPRMLDRLTVSDLVTRFRDNVVPLRRGRHNETIILNAFLRHQTATTKLSELGATQFATYRDERLLTVKAATINRELGLIQRVFEIARRELTYQEEEELNSIRSYVANIEATTEYRSNGPKRDPIPDDVKLLVWTRDGGACIRCGVKESLHFDHIIPVSKGGGNLADNIQLLCETCNLKKSNKIAF